MSEIVRSYSRDVLSRLERMPYACRKIGNASHDGADYPLLSVVAGNGQGNNKRNVLLSGGVHGDEPAGVFAVLEFLEHHAWEYLDRFRFFAYPCANPYGFERHNRDNPEGVNINRTFGDQLRSAEGEAIRQSLSQVPGRYLFTMDMHESGTQDGDIYEYVILTRSSPDVPSQTPQARYIKAREREMPLAVINNLFGPASKEEVFSVERCHDEKTRMCVEWSVAAKDMKANVYKIPYEFYLYEYCSQDERRVGEAIIDSLQHDTPICRWGRIAGDKSGNGVVRWPEGCENPEYAQMTSFDAFLFKEHTDLALTTETPKHWSIERRVETHIRALKAALDAYMER
ncbi:MAG: M14 family metallocarboxypeptidase [Nanoarchaeota archaeon]|nr:M14 family metallocarboxypeptidase [Nanoarchaeota archaeon]